MADSLTRMAERAMGVRPVVMPLVRPVFATPGKLEEQGFKESSRMAAVATEERVAPQTQSRDRDESYHDLGQEMKAPRAEVAPLAGPTLKEVIEHIYGPREALAAAKVVQPAMPSGSFLPARGIEDEGRDEKKDEEEQRKPLSMIEPGIEHALTYAADSQEQRKPLSMIEPGIKHVLAHAADSQEQRVTQWPVTADMDSGRETPTRSTPSLELFPSIVSNAPVHQAPRVVGDSFPRSATAHLQPPAKMRSETESPAHEVHVTIGRIELKTAPRPASPTPVHTSPRRAHLSLGEYLEHRRRGGRP